LAADGKKVRLGTTGATRTGHNAADEDGAEALAALGWQPAELDPALPPRVAYAGARHLVLAAASRERLADVDYDFARLRALMTARDR
jgi:predicted PhzF superfamily epimerase YddE/YHI9